MDYELWIMNYNVGAALAVARRRFGKGEPRSPDYMMNGKNMLYRPGARRGGFQTRLYPKTRPYMDDGANLN
jgi:hypothetical protein